MADLEKITNFEIFRWRAKTTEFVEAGAAIIKHDTALPAEIDGNFFVAMDDINGNPIEAYVPAGAATDTQLGTTLLPLQWQPATGTDITGDPANGGRIPAKKEMRTVVSKTLLLQTLQALEGDIGSKKKYNATPQWDISKPNLAQSVPIYQNATARDTLITAPIEGMKVKLTDEGIISSYIGGVWVAEGTEGIPNATESSSGKSQLATLEQQGAHTATSGGNPLVLQSKNTVKTHETYIPAYLTGGSNAESVFGTWATVTDGSFRITLDGVALNIDGINFTGNASMNDVAATIQAAIRAITSKTEIVVWSTDHFIITSSADTSISEVSVLSASTGTVGTDISGVSATNWMDSEAGNGVPTITVFDPTPDIHKTVVTDDIGNISDILVPKASNEEMRVADINNKFATPEGVKESISANGIIVFSSPTPTTIAASGGLTTFGHNLGITQSDVQSGRYGVVLSTTGEGAGILISFVMTNLLVGAGLIKHIFTSSPPANGDVITWQTNTLQIRNQTTTPFTNVRLHVLKYY